MLRYREKTRELSKTEQRAHHLESCLMLESPFLRDLLIKLLPESLLAFLDKQIFQQKNKELLENINHRLPAEYGHLMLSDLTVERPEDDPYAENRIAFYSGVLFAALYPAQFVAQISRIYDLAYQAATKNVESEKPTAAKIAEELKNYLADATNNDDIKIFFKVTLLFLNELRSIDEATVDLFNQVLSCLEQNEVKIRSIDTIDINYAKQLFSAYKKALTGVLLESEQAKLAACIANQIITTTNLDYRTEPNYVFDFVFILRGLQVYLDEKVHQPQIANWITTSSSTSSSSSDELALRQDSESLSESDRDVSKVKDIKPAKKKETAAEHRRKQIVIAFRQNGAAFIKHLVNLTNGCDLTEADQRIHQLLATATDDALMALRYLLNDYQGIWEYINDEHSQHKDIMLLFLQRLVYTLYERGIPFSMTQKLQAAILQSPKEVKARNIQTNTCYDTYEDSDIEDSFLPYPNASFQSPINFNAVVVPLYMFFSQMVHHRDFMGKISSKTSNESTDATLSAYHQEMKKRIKEKAVQARESFKQELAALSQFQEEISKISVNEKFAKILSKLALMVRELDYDLSILAQINIDEVPDEALIFGVDREIQKSIDGAIKSKNTIETLQVIIAGEDREMMLSSINEVLETYYGFELAEAIKCCEENKAELAKLKEEAKEYYEKFAKIPKYVAASTRCKKTASNDKTELIELAIPESMITDINVGLSHSEDSDGYNATNAQLLRDCRYMMHGTIIIASIEVAKKEMQAIKYRVQWLKEYKDSVAQLPKHYQNWLKLQALRQSIKKMFSHDNIKPVDNAKDLEDFTDIDGFQFSLSYSLKNHSPSDVAARFTDEYNAALQEVNHMLVVIHRKLKCDPTVGLPVLKGKLIENNILIASGESLKELADAIKLQLATNLKMLCETIDVQLDENVTANLSAEIKEVLELSETETLDDLTRFSFYHKIQIVGLINRRLAELTEIVDLCKQEGSSKVESYKTKIQSLKDVLIKQLECILGNIAKGKVIASYVLLEDLYSHWKSECHKFQQAVFKQILKGQLLKLKVPADNLQGYENKIDLLVAGIADLIGRQHFAEDLGTILDASKVDKSVGLFNHRKWNAVIKQVLTSIQPLGTDATADQVMEHFAEDVQRYTKTFGS